MLSTPQKFLIALVIQFNIIFNILITLLANPLQLFEGTYHYLDLGIYIERTIEQNI